ncbi:MAG: arsenite efflux transporter metallochaperone ArsD [Pelolinea sp.]|nr:arsenite efflux transporter metallochaperone ArsD [Pelolinea sp.]
MIQPSTVQQQTEFGSGKIVEIFDPPMCCPTGVCGPVLDQTLLDVNEMIFALQSKGIVVKRYQMVSDPNAFLNNEGVMRLVRERQIAALPIIVFNGNVIKSGGYPSLAEVEIALNERA